MTDFLLPDGEVWHDNGDGTFTYIPDVDTANALGVDWNDLTVVDSLPGQESGSYQSVDQGGGQPAAPPPPAAPPAAPGYSTGQDVIGPDGSVYRYEASMGAWRHIPDVATANAFGIDWNNLTATDGVPQPLGPDWPTSSSPPILAPPPTPPPPPAAIATGSSSPAPAASFEWGGQTWTQGELTAFVGWLAAHGSDYSTWAVNHPDAAAILKGPPTDPSREQVPKSVGEALGAAIANGATPEQAATQAAALAAAQAAQGFGAPQGAALLAAAQDVYDNYAAAGGVVAPAAPAPAPAPPADDGSERELQSVVPKNLFAASTGVPAGVTTSWKALVGFARDTVPGSAHDVGSVVTQIKGIFQ